MTNPWLLTSILVALATTAFFTVLPQPLHLLLGVSLIGLTATTIGNRLVSKRIPGIVIGLGVLLTVVALFTAVTYKLFDLSPLANMLALSLGIALSVVFANGITTVTPPTTEPDHKSISQGTAYWITRSAAVFFVLLVVGCFSMLIESRTAIPLRSPWHVVPGIFFSLLFITNLLGFGLLRRREISPEMSWFILVLLSAIPLSVGIIVYATGLGFDPFIHQATEIHIASFSAIEPKPWYYLGQYGLVVTLHRLTGIAIPLIDRLLLPLAATIFLPLTALFAVRQFTPAIPSAHAFTAATLLALPLALFTITTPQGIGYLLYLAVLALLLIEAPTQLERALTWLIALTTVITHPIAGIPALLLLGGVEVSRYFKKSILPLFILAIPILPLLFFLSGQNRADGQATTATLNDALPITQYASLVLDFVYGFNALLLPLAMLLILIGCCLAWQHGKLKRFVPFIAVSTVLLLDAFILRNFVSFNYLINYERGDYTERLLILAGLSLLPLLAYGLQYLWQRILSGPTVPQYLLVIVLALVSTTSAYLSYPRNDGYKQDRGYSTSHDDFLAVRAVAAMADEPYIVLANQAVSAAALREFGFSSYFQNHKNVTAEPIFYYPIPTGGPLYEYYLEMVYGEASKRTAMAAMDLTGTNRAYFILNDYWFNAERIAATAGTEASIIKRVGATTIFEFQR